MIAIRKIIDKIVNQVFLYKISKNPKVRCAAGLEGLGEPRTS